MNDEIAKELGFESAAEFFKMVADVDLTGDGLAAFKQWQDNDGTKQGLLVLGSAPITKGQS